MVGNILTHYRIIEKMGEGGMGIVYRAEDLKLKRFVAIKVLPSFVTASPDDRTRFFHEAQLASALSHPNIVTIHEFDESEGTAFIVSECVEGKTLGLMMQAGKLPLDTVIDIALQISSGLADAHAHGIVHRDIKPDNVMVTLAGQAKVMDFGLARLMGSSHVTSPGSLIGTFAYMSPEQIDEAEVDARSDIFSFGTLLYQMVAGDLPFHGKTVAELLSSISRKRPEPLKTFHPEVSGELERIVVKALQKDRQRRYQTMLELRADLKRLHDNPDIQAQTGGFPWFSRQSLLTAALVAVVIVMAGYIAWQKWHRDVSVQQPKSIAVLPFQNSTRDSSISYLSLGLTDYIITRLSYIHSILVKPTSMVVKYEGREVGAAEVGDELHSDYVLEGRFQRAAGNLLVNAQLVDVHTATVLWADGMVLPWQGIHTVQDAVSGNIVRALELHLTESENGEVHKTRTENPQAFEYYLRGISLTKKSTRLNNEVAMNMFERSIALDPRFAEAYSALSNTYIEQFWSNYSPDTMWVHKGEMIARQALTLDSELASAHASLGFALRISGHYREGILSTARALQLDPHDLQSLDDFSELYRHLGDFTKALSIVDRAAAIDPSFVHRIRARIYQFQGKYAESIPELQLAIQRSPDDPWLRGGLLAFSYIRLGDFAKAEEAIQDAERIDPAKPESHVSRAMIETLRGNFTKADDELGKVESYLATDYALARHTAAIYARQNRVDLALTWVEKSVRLGNRWYSWYMSDPWFDSIRNQPRFQSAMREMKSELDSIAEELRPYNF
jgi:serine/threonine protein kinase